jgi:hypothetical protein
MASNYPASIDSFPTRAGGETMPPSDFNDQNDSILAIQNTLGTNPQGSESTVSDRLNTLGNPVLAFRNAIINGGFRVNQRGFTDFIDNESGFCVDRFYLSNQGMNAGTRLELINHVNISDQPLSNGSYPSFLRLSGTLNDTANGFTIIQQAIEDSSTLSGETITVTIKCKGSISGDIGVRIFQFTGSGGGEGAIPAITPQIISVTTSSQIYSLQFDLPSMDDIGLGANNNDNLRLAIDKNLGSNFNSDNGQFYTTKPNYTGDLDIEFVQLEKGDTFTGFEYRPLTVEENLCYRFYERIDTNIVGWQASATDTFRNWLVIYKVRKRTNSPTATAIGGTALGANVNSATEEAATFNKNFGNTNTPYAVTQFIIDAEL